MPRELPAHAMAMAVLIAASLYFVHVIGPALPPIRLAIDLVMLTAFVLVWSWMMVQRIRAARRQDHAPLSWREQDRTIVWMGNGLMIAGFWLGMPYAPEWIRFLGVMGQCATVTAEMLGTIERPPAKAPLAYAPMALPVATAAYYVVYWETYSPMLILFLLSYAFVVWQLGRILQGAVDRAYADRLTAEAALAEVAAERDAKTRFLTSASHDLGQPLQAARLFFDQVMRASDPALRDAAARRVAWAFDSTEQLLRQMLDHLKLESGAVEPHLDRLAVGPLIARIAEMNEPAARLAGVEILAMPTRLQVTADPALVERILANLVGNAIRHAKARRVLVGARRSAGRIRLWVIDDGVGISEADAARLFEDFVQGSNHGDEIRGGFGLGLASARRMAGLMGGAVGLDRRWLAGSAFWLELPASEAKAA